MVANRYGNDSTSTGYGNHSTAYRDSLQGKNAYSPGKDPHQHWTDGQIQRDDKGVYFTTFFHLFHSQPSTFFAVKQVSNLFHRFFSIFLPLWTSTNLNFISIMCNSINKILLLIVAKKEFIAKFYYILFMI